MFIVLLSVQGYYYQNKLNKATDLFKKQIDVLKDSIKVLDAKEYKIIERGSIHTQKASNKQQAIKDKLKKDEEIINNRSVSRSDIDSLLARFNKGSE